MARAEFSIEPPVIARHRLLLSFVIVLTVRSGRY
jgi:hypothetical protein